MPMMGFGPAPWAPLAAEWDFTNWCYASGYDANDQDACLMFECLLAYAMGEGRAGLH